MSKVKEHKPKITAANKMCDGSVAVFWDEGSWRNSSVQVLACDNVEGDYQVVCDTHRRSHRIKNPDNIRYIKLIVTNDEKGIYITKPVEIQMSRSQNWR